MMILGIKLSVIVLPATAFAIIVVFKMLSQDIAGLKVCIETLSQEVKQLREGIARNNELTGRLEERTGSAHKRLDGLEKRITHLESGCENCSAKD